MSTCPAAWQVHAMQDLHNELCTMGTKNGTILCSYTDKKHKML
jgi:hypothetical protein